MFRHILVPTEGSESSEATVRKAVTFAREIGARITALHVRPEFVAGGYYAEAGLALKQAAEEESLRARAFSAKTLRNVEALCREAGVPCTTESVSSPLVYEAIIETATRCACDLIFMASHGRSGIGALLLGSETQKVLTHSKIPVLVCR